MARRAEERGQPRAAPSSRGSDLRGCAGPLASVARSEARPPRAVAAGLCRQPAGGGAVPWRERAAAPGPGWGCRLRVPSGAGQRGAWKWRRGRPGRGLGRAAGVRARGPASAPPPPAEAGRPAGRAGPAPPGGISSLPAGRKRAGQFGQVKGDAGPSDPLGKRVGVWRGCCSNVAGKVVLLPGL